jgi:hypothetical protein
VTVQWVREWEHCASMFTSRINREVWIGMPAESPHMDTVAGGYRSVRRWLEEYAAEHFMPARGEDVDEIMASMRFRVTGRTPFGADLEMSVLRADTT